METVSVIIPVYKVEQYITQCIDSVIKQTYSNLEIILVDDGSPDKCGSICDNYSKVDNRIKVIHKQNQGLGLARNTGLAAATGKYVVFVDSDDWLEKDHIGNIVTAIENSGADIVVHGFQYRVEDRIPQKCPPFKIGIFTNIIDEVLLPMMSAKIGDKEKNILPVGSWCKLYRKEIIANNKLYFINEKQCISEDVLFNIDYLRCCKKACIIDECGYNYRMNPNSISNAYDDKRTPRMFRFFEDVDQIFNSDIRLNTSEAKQHLERCYIAKSRVGLRLICNSTLPLKQKIIEIYKILNHPTLQRALRNFPIRTYNQHLFFITILMRIKMVPLLLVIYTLKKS